MSNAYWSPTGSTDPRDMIPLDYEVREVEFTPNIASAFVPAFPDLPSIEFYAEPRRHIPEPIPGYVVMRTEDGRIVQYRKFPNGDIELVALPGNYSFADLDEITRAVQQHMEPNATMTTRQPIREFVEASGLNPMPESDDIEYDDDSTELPEQTMWVLEDGTSSPYGPIERQLREDVGALKLGGHLSKTLVETAYALARELDRGAKMATAAVAKQLREYVTEIERLAGDDDDTRSHNADLSSPV